MSRSGSAGGRAGTGLGANFLFHRLVGAEGKLMHQKIYFVSPTFHACADCRVAHACTNAISKKGWKKASDDAGDFGFYSGKKPLTGAYRAEQQTKELQNGRLGTLSPCVRTILRRHGAPPTTLLTPLPFYHLSALLCIIYIAQP